MKKQVCVSEKLEENPARTGNFLNTGNSLQGSKSSSGSSALRGENYSETSACSRKESIAGQVFETGKGHKVRVVEVYGSKPIDEVLEKFSKYISQFL